MTSLLATVAFLVSFSKAIRHIEKYLNLHGLSQQMEIWQHSRSHPVFLLSQILQLHTNLVIGGYPLLHISEDQQKNTSVDMSAKCLIQARSNSISPWYKWPIFICEQSIREWFLYVQTAHESWGNSSYNEEPCNTIRKKHKKVVGCVLIDLDQHSTRI